MILPEKTSVFQGFPTFDYWRVVISIGSGSFLRLTPHIRGQAQHSGHWPQRTEFFPFGVIHGPGPWVAPTGIGITHMAHTVCPIHTCFVFTHNCILYCMLSIYIYLYLYLYTYVHMYIPATSTCAKFWPLGKEYKMSDP